MRGVEVSELNLGTDGGITVKGLATVFEDGEIIGQSYLASSLRKSVEARGPLDLERVVRLYNSGYYGASWINKKARTYLKPGQQAPEGTQEQTGPRGGRYYEPGGKPTKPRAVPSRDKGRKIDAQMLAFEEAIKSIRKAPMLGPMGISMEQTKASDTAVMHHVAQELGQKTGISQKRVLSFLQGWQYAFMFGELGENPYWLALNMAVARTLGENPTRAIREGWSEYAYQAGDGADKQLAEAETLVQAVYDDTQEWLKEHGFRSVYAMRGAAFDTYVPAALKGQGKKWDKIADSRARSTLAWSLAPDIAIQYAEADEDSDVPYSTVLFAELPAKNVVSLPFTGFGLAHSYEVISAGAPKLPVFVRGLKIDPEEHPASQKDWLLANDLFDWEPETYNASWVNKGRVYLKEGQEAPAGMAIKEGPRGGRYYETGAGRGRPLGEAPSDWKPREGERIRLRLPGDKRNGRLARVREIHVGEGWREGKMYAVVDGIGWSGGGYIDIEEGMLVPAPYTAKEKKEMTARNILIAEFGKTAFASGRPHRDDDTGLDYDLFHTEAGPLLWVKSEPGKDKPWAMNKDSAVSLDAFMGALLEMPTEALQSMKSEVQSIIFSPVGNPSDRKTSQQIGKNFTSSASMDMERRTMYIWPASKKADAKRLAQTLTHETGHAVDQTRSALGALYMDGVRDFWNDLRENEGIQIPASIREQEAIEAERGVPPDPNKWQDDWGRWMNVALGKSNPEVAHYWPSIQVESSWRKLSDAGKLLVEKNVKNAVPVTNYAQRNVREYYAEAYTWYQLGELPDYHVMYNHFANLERTKQWLNYQPST